MRRFAWFQTGRRDVPIRCTGSNSIASKLCCNWPWLASAASSKAFAKNNGARGARRQCLQIEFVGPDGRTDFAGRPGGEMIREVLRMGDSRLLRVAQPAT